MLMSSYKANKISMVIDAQMEYEFSHIKGRSLHNPVLHLSLIGHFISEGSEKNQQVVCVLRVFYLRQDACMIKHDTDIYDIST